MNIKKKLFLASACLIALQAQSAFAEKMYTKIDVGVAIPMKFDNTFDLGTSTFKAPVNGNAMYDFAVGVKMGHLRAEGAFLLFNTMKSESYLADKTILPGVALASGNSDLKTSAGVLQLFANNAIAQKTTYKNIQNVQGKAAMANIYYDIGNFHNIVPSFFVGAGLGILSPEDIMINQGMGFSRFMGKNSTNLAWSLGCNIGYTINDKLILDLSYAYIDMGKAKYSGAETQVAAYGSPGTYVTTDGSIANTPNPAGNTPLMISSQYTIDQTKTFQTPVRAHTIKIGMRMMF